MADKENKLNDNAQGPYYVDEECTACEVCAGTAPDNFKMADDGSHAFVYKQPENDDEKAVCEDALESCPADAIGNDG